MLSYLVTYAQTGREHSTKEHREFKWRQREAVWFGIFGSELAHLTGMHPRLGRAFEMQTS